MKRFAMVILWPSFLVAIVEEGFFFALFDPQDLALIFSHVELADEAAYTVGFFCFWLFSALASILTYYLVQVPLNKPQA